MSLEESKPCGSIRGEIVETEIAPGLCVSVGFTDPAFVIHQGRKTVADENFGIPPHAGSIFWTRTVNQNHAGRIFGKTWAIQGSRKPEVAAGEMNILTGYRKSIPSQQGQYQQDDHTDDGDCRFQNYAKPGLFFGHITSRYMSCPWRHPSRHGYPEMLFH